MSSYMVDDRGEFRFQTIFGRQELAIENESKAERKNGRNWAEKQLSGEIEDKGTSWS